MELSVDIPLERIIFDTGDEVHIFNHVLADISKARPLTGEGYRIFLSLLGTIDKENYIPSPTEIAEKLGLQRANASRAYQGMLSDGYLIKDEGGYRIHPFIAYRGSNIGRTNAISKLLIASCLIPYPCLPEAEQILRGHQ